MFQHRCMRRLEEMRENGVTILFVSHDPSAIRALCSRAILLNEGRVVADGVPSDVLNRYQKLIMARERQYQEMQNAPSRHTQPNPRPSATLGNYTYRHGDGSAEILKVELWNAAGEQVELVETGERVSVKVTIGFTRDVDSPVSGFLIRNRHGIHLYGTNTDLKQSPIGPTNAGEIVEVRFDFHCWLAPDSYSLAVAAHGADAVSYDWVDGALFFRVMSADRMEGVANLDATAVVIRSDSVFSQNVPVAMSDQRKAD